METYYFKHNAIFGTSNLFKLYLLTQMFPCPIKKIFGLKDFGLPDRGHQSL